jgi:hypothetical protein
MFESIPYICIGIILCDPAYGKGNYIEPVEQGVFNSVTAIFHYSRIGGDLLPENKRQKKKKKVKLTM